MNKEIERDILSWFEYNEATQSGYLGYPKAVCYEPGSRVSVKRDRTPNSAIPEELIFIDSVLREMEKRYLDVLWVRLICDIEDNNKANLLNCSIAKYYTLCREVMAYLKGAYTTHYSTRRKTKHLQGIPL